MAIENEIVYPPSGSYWSFVMWNRLESRPRKLEFEEVLRTEVHDPLFMLSRQWQFGEFQAEDTGSAIFAKVALRTSKITRIKKDGQAAKAFQNDIPLEAQVESLPIQWSLNEKVQLGNQWVKFLEKNSIGIPSFNLLDYKNIFLTNYTFSLVGEYAYDSSGAVIDSENEIISKAKVLGNQKLNQYLNLIAGRKIDGFSIWNEIQSGGNSIFSSLALSTSDATILENACIDFVNWVNSMYVGNNITSLDETCWNKNKLEYGISASIPNYDGQANTVIQAQKYHHGTLDSYAFDQSPLNQSPTDLIDNGTSIAGLNENVTFTKTISVIPTESRFPGMPATRWWEFEDGRVNFGRVDANTTDITKILLTEFSLVYQDDWFVIPYNVPVGSLSEVTGIVVKDVFGQQTLVQHAGLESNNWEDWNLYKLSLQDNEPGVFPADKRLFFPPSINKTQESEVLEEVAFVRDEMANLVWAIEKKINNGLGEGIDGYQVLNEFKNKLLEAKPDNGTIISEEGVTLTYRLGNSVPENWIPFIPVHNSSSNRSIQLQRASMPRQVSSFSHKPIRPRTSFLRHGIDENDNIISSSNSEEKRYFIHEEEVPRSGVVIKSTIQKARWFDGKTYLWYGAKKQNGRGQANSNLQFDKILDKKLNDE